MSKLWSALFGTKKGQTQNDEEATLHRATVEIVSDAKKTTGAASKEAQQQIDKLNELLIENGITLKISIAAGAGRKK